MKQAAKEKLLSDFCSENLEAEINNCNELVKGFCVMMSYELNIEMKRSAKFRTENIRLTKRMNDYISFSHFLISALKR